MMAINLDGDPKLSKIDASCDALVLCLPGYIIGVSRRSNSVYNVIFIWPSCTIRNITFRGVINSEQLFLL